MKDSFKKGLGFGLTSGVITTLGLIVGLYSGTNSLPVVLAGVFIIAISDSMSDSLGIHISEETQKNISEKSVWEATISTFLSKFFITIHFVIPFILFELKFAIIISVAWGLTLIGLLSFFIAREKNIPAKKLIFEHIFIATLVIILTHLVGEQISKFFQLA
jgi:vacuolar iron transporter family protein